MKVQELRGLRPTEYEWLEKKLQNNSDEKFLEWFKESGAITCPSQIEMMTGVTNPDVINTKGKALLARQIAGETLDKAWCFVNEQECEDDVDGELENLFCIKTIAGVEYLFGMGWQALGLFILKKAQVLSEV